MSLRSIGNQLLQTAPSTLLLGASTASLSAWVRVNSGCNVANSNGVEIFGDAGGRLSATLSGSGGLRLGWLSRNGSTNGSSSYGLTLVSGTSYHLATTWQDGAQQYYVNGVQVHADTQAGSIGVVGDSSPHPFRLGSDSAGTDVTVDEPTLWVGYALSAQDVLNLRDRAVQPAAIAPSSIALQWSLAGPDGVAARVGDAGLADSSATGLNLTAVVGTAMAYQAGVLSYVPPAKIGVATIAPSGQGLILVFEDGAGNPSNLASLRSSSDQVTLTLTGPPAGGAYRLTFNGQATGPIAVATNLPASHGLWTIPVIAGQSYKFAVPVRLGSHPGVLHRFYDGAVGAGILASVTVNENSGSDFTYGLAGDNTAESWLNVATVTPTGTTLSILVTAPVGRGELVNLDALYVQKVSDSSIAVYDDLDPACSHGAGFEAGGPSEAGRWHGSFWAFNAGGNDNYCTMLASDVQAALLAIGLSVTVTSSDNVTCVVSFVGPMRDAAQPLMTSSDPAVTVAHTIVGGVVPSITVPRFNGGLPIPLLDWEWQITNAPALPFAFYPFRQAIQGTHRTKAGWGLLPNYTGAFTAGNGGYAGYSYYSTDPTATYNLPYQGLPPGTYQLAVTWQPGLPFPDAFNGAFTTLSNTAHFLVKDSSGATLATLIVDQTHAPADFTEDGVGWHILGNYAITSPINGLTVALTAAGSTRPVVADGARLVRTSADDSLTILPADRVTLDVPSGWAACVAGAIPSVTGQTVATNLVGQPTAVPFVAAPKTMKVGYNTEGDTLGETIYRYSNLANRIQGPLGLTNDANQYPLTSAGPSISGITMAQTTTLYTAMNGLHTFLWDGAKDDISVQGQFTTVVEKVALRNLTGGANNRRVFNLQATGNDVSPNFGITLTSATRDPSDGTHANYLHDIQNLRVYPPDPSDPTGMTAWGTNPSSPPPRFHPTYLDKLRGVQCLRFMDSQATNNSALVEFSDYVPSSRLGYVTPTRVITVPVADYRGYTGSDVALDVAGKVVVQITTTVPHGFVDGQVVVYPGAGTITLTGGATYPAGNAGSNVRVLSPTVILLVVQTSGDVSGQSMTNVLTGGFVETTIIGGSGMTFADCIGLADAASSVTDIWVNIPFCASDACITAMGTYVAQNLKAACKVHVEFSNETWNESFFNWYACCAETRKLGLGGFQVYQPGYVAKFSHAHTLFATAMATYGRGGDMIRTVGTWTGQPSASLDGIISAAIARGGVQIDEICVSPYFNNGTTYEPSLQYLYDLHTVDQDIDLMSFNFLYSSYFNQMGPQVRAILDANGYASTKIVGYESGPTQLYPMPIAANVQYRNHAIGRHPRMYWVTLQWLQGLQDNGLSLANIFYIAGGTDTWQWGTYWNWNQLKGTGDPVADALNVSAPEAAVGVKSEVGGGVAYWGSLNVGSSNPQHPRRPIPGRNGQIRATGYPRGLFRPTR